MQSQALQMGYNGTVHMPEVLQIYRGCLHGFINLCDGIMSSFPSDSFWGFNPTYLSLYYYY